MGGYAMNYAAVSEVDAYTSVVPVTPTVNVIDNGGTYNATAFVATATVNGQSNLEGVTPTLDYQQLVNGSWHDLGANAPVNAGSYDVTANFAGSTDYTAVSSSTVDFNITQAPITIGPNIEVTYGKFSNSQVNTMIANDIIGLPSGNPDGIRLNMLFSPWAVVSTKNCTIAASGHAASSLWGAPPRH